MEKVFFAPEDGAEPVAFYVLDQCVLRGATYILVTDSEDGDGTAMILKDTAPENASESVFEVVEDDREIEAVLLMFKDTLEDLDIGIEE